MRDRAIHTIVRRDASCETTEGTPNQANQNSNRFFPERFGRGCSPSVATAAPRQCLYKTLASPVGHTSSKSAPCPCVSFGPDTRRLSVQYSPMRNNPDHHCNGRHHNTSTAPISLPLCDRWGSDTFWHPRHNGGRCETCLWVVRYGSVSQSDGICSAGASRFPRVSLSCCDNFSIFLAPLIPGPSI